MTTPHVLTHQITLYEIVNGSPPSIGILPWMLILIQKCISTKRNPGLFYFSIVLEETTCALPSFRTIALELTFDV